jgi:hypothetical protein
MFQFRNLYLIALVGVVACATPNEVKQATTALDKAYDENAALVRQYRETFDSMSQLEESWSRYVTTRNLLNLALTCATQDPDAKTLPIVELVLGDALVGWVNGHRLPGLQAQSKLTAGPKEGAKNAVGKLIQGLPELVSLIGAKVDASAMAHRAVREAALSKIEHSAKDVEVLKGANHAVKDYLDVDVTVSKDDVQTIAQAIETLRGHK